MGEIEDYKKLLLDEIENFQADAELMQSPLWGRMKQVFSLRREMLMSLVMADEGDNPSRANRLKGRFQESEYFLGFANLLKEGEAQAVTRLQELDEEEMNVQMEEGE